MGARLRIVSANLWNGGADAQAFAELVAELGADVVATQEMAPEQAEALTDVMSYGHVEPNRHHHGRALLTRHAVELSTIPLDSRSAQVVHLDPCDWEQLQSPIDIVNIHVYAPQVFHPKVGLAVRRRQVRDFRRFLDDPGDRTLHDRAVVVGDFNATPLWPVYRFFAGRFTDAATSAAEQLGRPAVRTWGPWHGSPRMLRIDHGFVRGVAVEAFDVVPVRGSDHDAVVLDLRLD